MSQVLRQRAIEALGEAVRPFLEPDVHEVLTVEADPDARPCYPNLLVRAVGRFTFEAFEDEQVAATARTQTVHVGDMSGVVELVLGATSAPERERLGSRVLDAFLQDELRRGVLVVRLRGLEVSGYPLAAEVPVAFCLSDDGWRDELVFDRKRYQTLTVSVDFPVLVTRSNVPDISELVLALTGDVTSEDTPTDYVQVGVEADGDLTPHP